MSVAIIAEQIKTIRGSVENLQTNLDEDEFFNELAERIRVRRTLLARLDDIRDRLYEMDVELANVFIEAGEPGLMPKEP
jgi:hypothetical protein